MKKLTEFENLDDFGFELNIINGGVEYTLPDGENSIVHVQDDNTSGKFYTMEEILSGGSTSITLDESVRKDQAELTLDYNISTSIAFLGSVYSNVSFAINGIKDTYPNGFLIQEASTGTSTLTFDNNQTYMYGLDPFAISDYTEYELVQSGAGPTAIFAITSASTGPTATTLTVVGQPDTGATYDHWIQPTEGKLSKFYLDMSQYQMDLLIPPYNKTNYWPRDLLATNNLLFEGTSYDDFVNTELDFGTLADNEDANFIWRTLYPDGQKNLDSDNSIMQKLILTYAMNFDTIKRYQDQLKYQHHIGYENSNHISKDLVELLASQWNWSLGHNLKQDDYSAHLLATYDNYITGYSAQKLSAKDINFEIWRRVLANLVSLYKKKGTKEAIKYVANIYGLPEQLLWVEELINTVVNGQDVLTTSESNIVIPINGVLYYVNDSGAKTTLENQVVTNTKYLNVNISPMDAIEFDYSDWGWDNHPNIFTPDGFISVTDLYTSQPSKERFVNDVSNIAIGSNPKYYKYESKYSILEGLTTVYYDNSVNKYQLATLEPYMDFLDDNWNILITNLIPAGSKLLSVGNLYRNTFWHREKYKWNESEKDAKELPLNEEILLQHVTPEISVNTTTPVDIDVHTIAGNQMTKVDSNIIVQTVSANKSATLFSEIPATEKVAFISQRLYGLYNIEDPTIDYIEELEDLENIDPSTSGTILTTNSPLVEAISGQGGTLSFTGFTSEGLVVTNQDTFDVVYSASNLSDSGYTQIKFELFKKQYDRAVTIDTSIDFSILNVEYENADYGTYRVSSVQDIDEFDFIQIESDYLPYLNSLVQVTHIDSGRTMIRTQPKIGLFNIPTGVHNTRVDWIDFHRSGSIDAMRNINHHCALKYGEMIDIIQQITTYGEERSTSEFEQFSLWLSANYILPPNGNQYFLWFFSQPQAILYACLLVLEYVKHNKSWSLDSNNIALINVVSNSQVKATFKRVIDFFNWRIADQSVVIDNIPTNNRGGDWNLPEIDVDNRSVNDYNTTGTVTMGGLNYLNANILVDKEEYFLRYKLITHCPLSWGTVSGLAYFPLSGGSLLESGYDLSYLNDIKYYGKYFMYMKTPKQAIANIEGTDSSGVLLTDDASVISKWHGVGDSSRLELQYLKATGETQYTGYTEIPTTAWTSEVVTTIDILSRDAVGDDYIYTVQTTLQPDTYYWWRVKNFKSKLSMFGYNLEYFTSTQPDIFLTGSFGEGGAHDGEVLEQPTLPIGGGRGDPSGDQPV